jgi:hypothetical protein
MKSKIRKLFTSIASLRPVVPCSGCLVTKIIGRGICSFKSYKLDGIKNPKCFLNGISSICAGASLLTFVSVKVLKSSSISKWLFKASVFLSKASDIIFYIAVCYFLILEFLKLKKLGKFSYFLSS